MSSRFYRNSEASASEFLENREGRNGPSLLIVVTWRYINNHTHMVRKIPVFKGLIYLIIYYLSMSLIYLY